MVDSTLLVPPGFRVLDAQGDSVSGAKMKFWEGGTNVPKPVYSDQGLSTSLGPIVYTRSDGFFVASQLSNTTVSVYIGSGLYDVEITDANDVTIYPRKINQKGALDTSGFLTSADASLLSIPVVSTAENLTLATAYNGKHVRGNTASQSVTLVLDSAATLGDAWNVEVSKAAAANTLRLATTSSQTINFNGQSHTSLVLSELGEGVSIRCDGSAFYVATYTPPLRNTVGVIVITDRVASAPGAPTPGARYIVTAPFSTFEADDIIEADASGGFIEYTPASGCGWVAYVQDELQNYQFRTTWRAMSDQPATPAEMEAASSAIALVTPGRQHFHPGHPKFWARVLVSGGVPVIAASYNVTSVVDAGTGVLTVNIGTDFSSAAWCCLVTVEGGALYAVVSPGGIGAGSVQLTCRTVAGDVLADPASWHVLGFGDQA